jgi:pentatricopeptide repeat protein
MTPRQASLFIELLTNAGWIDDADELLQDMLDCDVPVEDVRVKAKLIDATINEANALLDGIEQPIDANIESTLDEILEDE